MSIKPEQSQQSLDVESSATPNQESLTEQRVESISSGSESVTNQLSSPLHEEERGKANTAQSYHAFVCIFKDYQRLEALLLACVERGLPGGTLIDGRGMGQVLCQDIPLFIHLRERFPAADGDSHIFLSIVTGEQLDICFDLAESIGGPAAQGVVFSLPVGRFQRFSLMRDYFSINQATSSESQIDEELESPTPQD